GHEGCHRGDRRGVAVDHIEKLCLPDSNGGHQRIEADRGKRPQILVFLFQEPAPPTEPAGMRESLGRPILLLRYRWTSDQFLRGARHWHQCQRFTGSTSANLSVYG